MSCRLDAASYTTMLLVCECVCVCEYLCATDEPDGAQAGTVGLQGVHPGLHHLRVTGQTQVVVGTEVQDGWW